MKKVSIILTIFVIMIGMVAPVFAAELTNKTSTGNVRVTYGVTETYTVTIPETIELNENEVEATISASDVKISYGTELKVSISSKNYSEGWELLDTSSNTNNKISYTIGRETKSTDVLNNADVLTVAAGTTTGEQTLFFNLAGAQNVAGSYEDTLTFTVAVAVKAQ